MTIIFLSVREAPSNLTEPSSYLTIFVSKMGKTCCYPPILLITVLLASCGDTSLTPAGIGPEGGIVVSGDGRARVQIPEGALAEPTDIQIHREPSWDSKTKNDALVIYRFEPEGLRFAKPVTITIQYAPEDLGDGIDPHRLRLATLVDDRWGLLESRPDPVRHTVTGKTTHFSLFGIVPLEHTWDE
jgi:hypothetical protein